MLCHLLTKLELTASASMAQRLTDDCVCQWVNISISTFECNHLEFLNSSVLASLQCNKTGTNTWFPDNVQNFIPSLSITSTDIITSFCEVLELLLV